jgi:hypothetical protein
LLLRQVERAALDSLVDETCGAMIVEDDNRLKAEGKSDE